MNTTIEQAFSIIEEWNAKKTKELLVTAENNVILQKAILDRYQPLIDHVEGKDWLVLRTLPKKITTQKTLKKQWEPDEKTQAIMATLPIDFLSLRSLKEFPLWIVYLSQVEHIYMNSKGLTLPEEFSFMKNLKNVIFENSKLNSVPTPLKNLPNLQQLDLYGNELTELPSWLFSLPLEKLEVGGNKIQRLPASLGEAKQLMEIDLSNNKLKELPSSIGELSALITLNLTNNQLSSLPDSVKNLSALEVFKIRGNKFISFPEVVTQCSSLKAIDASFMPLSELSPQIGNLQSLCELNISYTKVRVLPYSIHKLKKLETLELNDTLLARGGKVTGLTTKKKVETFLATLPSQELQEEKIAIYRELESRNATKVSAALQTLETKPQLKKYAEERYLPFIQARLNNPKATLSQLPEAALTTAEENKLLDQQASSTVLGTDYLSFEYFNDEESKLLVDCCGSLVATKLDIEQFCKEASQCQNQKELTKYAKEKLKTIRQNIFHESNVYSNGWFGKLYHALSDLNLITVRFNKTKFTSANRSLVLKEFYFFLNLVSDHAVYLDIFQSEPPKLTDIFWLLPTIPSTKWFDVEANFPSSPLSFERIAEVKIGDTENWKKLKG